jgi:hypothetical protein
MSSTRAISTSTQEFYAQNPVVLPVYKYTHVLKVSIKQVLSLKRLDSLVRTLCDSDPEFAEMYKPYLMEKTVPLAIAEKIVKGHVNDENLIVIFQRSEERICH